MKKDIIKIFLMFMFGSLLVACSSEVMDLSETEYFTEYGETISTKASDYLENDDEDFLKNIKIENVPKNEKGKGYPAVGEYEMVLKNDDEEQAIKVIVKDTIAPSFVTIADNYEVEFGKQLDVKKFNDIATDLSEMFIALDDFSVDYKKAGEYNAVLSAVDKWDNKTEKEITIIVKPEKKKEPEKKSNSSTNKKNTNTSSNKSSSKKTSGKETTSKPQTTNPEHSKDTVYWTPNGKSYHTTKNCPTLSRSKTILNGSLSKAKSAGKNDPCDRCH